MPSSADRDLVFFKDWIVSTAPNATGEWRMFCPVCEDPSTSKTPSASINFGKGLYHCVKSTCNAPGSVRGLKAYVREKEATGGEVASYDPFATSSSAASTNVVSINKNKDEKKKVEELTESRVRAWHNGLLEEKKLLDAFMARRSLTLETINQFQIGYDFKSGRYTIPIRDESGILVNVRKYKPDAEASQKMWNTLGYGSPPRLFPIGVIADATDVLIVEGEMDALICIQNGIPAVTGTGGAGLWHPSWSKQFNEKNVFIYYDNDNEGRVGAKKVARALAKNANTVRIVPPQMEENKSDATDFFQAGLTAEMLLKAMHSAQLMFTHGPEEEGADATVVEASVVGSMDASTNGKRLRMTATVSGAKHPPYNIPHEVIVHCDMSAGPKCKVCVMQTDYEGTTDVNISKSDSNVIARFLDSNETQRTEIVRSIVRAQPCRRFEMEVTSSYTVNEIFVSTNVDRHNLGRSDYTNRRVYVIGDPSVETNTVATLTGTTISSPKDARNEFVAWDIEQAETSIDSFKMTPELMKQLRIFQTHGSQTPLAKMRSIAEDLSRSVTRIRGRERLIMCMDIAWHSILHFEFEGKIMDRSWVEFIVVGDTRTGKSATAIQLNNHYQLGHIIGCEGATFAGLVGGVKQIGKEWAIQWGEITVNDRRLCVLDEASGLSPEIIGRMSDVRARGIAQVTAIETRSTQARCRLIWISNPRPNKYVDEKLTSGVDILQNVIGNPEDIARFDLAMSVRSTDVSSAEINQEYDSVETKYSSEACHNLILWAWSRKPDHVVLTEGTVQKVFEGARYLSERYIENPQLIQAANVKEKIIRIAAAIAARTFSTDDGERLLIKSSHVTSAVQFMHQIYSYDNFGYRRNSLRFLRNREIARNAVPEVRSWLRENGRVLEFLIDRQGTSFRSTDLEEMAFMDRHQVNEVISLLSSYKMLTKEKSQLVMEPELQALISQMEKRRK
jgi:hypothetical protein